MWCKEGQAKRGVGERRTFLLDEVGGRGLSKDLSNLVEVAIEGCLEEVREHDTRRKREEVRVTMCESAQL